MGAHLPTQGERHDDHHDHTVPSGRCCRSPSRTDLHRRPDQSPDLDATSITTTDVMARTSLKMLMAALAFAGITGVYLRQVTTIGVLGLLGYVALLALGTLATSAVGFVPQYER